MGDLIEELAMGANRQLLLSGFLAQLVRFLCIGDQLTDCDISFFTLNRFVTCFRFVCDLFAGSLA